MLGISTSTPRGSAALVQGERVLGRAAYEDEHGHAERIFGLLDELFAASGIARAEVAALCCDVGPGSFTGVRAGLAAAKGIALGAGLPLIGVGGLEAMAAAGFAALAPDSPLLRLACAVDAKRGEIFLAIYDRAGAVLAPPSCVRRDAVADVLCELLGAADVGLVGGTLEACGLGEERRIRGHGCDLPDAVWVARCGAARLARGELVPLGEIEPIYVRPPDATPAPARAVAAGARR
ncbi:MAG: tRNA (adenosine(37)-N6)-threonylcarbamoyltransferase complex dimerization subunit type 1 TsaB [Deltaproteobacteria bacterium]|nr:tRNA (adenosine(37)-N6)-threonylcarbamoyltransferase complex dimerization subunit type 1 TsaB [Deltaproteobacteria bacterium]